MALDLSLRGRFHLSKSMTALLMMIAAHFCFSLMIALIKAAQRLQSTQMSSAHHGAQFGTWESVLFRSLPMTFICLFVFFRRTCNNTHQQSLTGKDIRWLLIRGLIGAASMACFFYGTLHIPIAIASLFANASVLFIGMLGHFFLGERLTRPRVLFTLVGFAGVAMVLGTGFFPAEKQATAVLPGSGHSHDFMIAFMAGILSSVAYFSVRKMKHIPSNTIILSLSLSGVFLALLAGLTVAPLRIPDDPRVLALLCLSGLPAVAAQHLMTRAFQQAEAGFVALGQYMGPVFAAFLGLVAFDEQLTLAQWLGAGITICFGIMMPLLDDRRTQRATPAHKRNSEPTLDERIPTQ